MRIIATFLLLTASLVLSACSTTGEEQADSIRDSDTAVPTSTPPAVTPSQPAPTSTPAPTATPVPAGIKLLEAGFTTYTDSGGNLIGAWAAVLQNVDTGHQATDTSVTALFYSADNVVLKTDQQAVTLFLPGMVSAAGSNYVSLTAKPARIEVRIAGTKYGPPPSSAINFAATDVTFAPASFSSAINGKIGNPSSRDITQMHVICMMVAADGTYPAIGTAYIDLMPAGATTVATCRLDSRMAVPAGATPRMFPSFSFITKIAQ